MPQTQEQKGSNADTGDDGKDDTSSEVQPLNQVFEYNIFSIGGGGLPRSISNQMVADAGGKDSRLAVITTAKDEERCTDEKVCQNVARYFTKRGFGTVETFHAADEEEANTDDFVARLIAFKPTCIYFCGGSQSRYIRYVDTKTEQALHKLASNGCVITGTSAGCAIMARTMIACTSKKRPKRPILRKGLGFIPGVILDQHFIKRNRAWRLQKALRLNPTYVGIGVDEATCLHVQGDQVTVLGKSKVVVFDPVDSLNRDGDHTASNKAENKQGDGENLEFKRTEYKSGEIFFLSHHRHDINYEPTSGFDEYEPADDEDKLLAEQTFAKFDIDGSGSISKDEFCQALKELNLDYSDEEAVTMFEECDVDESSTLCLSEFVALLGF